MSNAEGSRSRPNQISEERLCAAVRDITAALPDHEALELVLAALEHCDDERSAADLAVEFGLDNAIGRDAAVTAIRTVQGRE